ncbi:hypothetical protein QCA50_009036 [Cerrena zonata]|uniref:Fungal-type protein kinase domain-containing protein n=1 Tax=Cerrena zonata TaxID=2478898 RepID=A0AAW0G611_9APHY
MAICCIEKQQQQIEVGICGLQMIAPDLHKRMEDTQTVRVVIFDIPMPITTFTGGQFCKSFLQTIRCHALLWFRGIEHGDISDTNLMVDPVNDKGILTDFDLATIVDKDAIDPLHGVDRTGTMVFMSVELLDGDGQQGKIPRLYRHDLESFCWVFFWICYCYDNGVLRPRYPCTEWINVTSRQCGNAKANVARKFPDTKATKSYVQFQPTLKELVEYWANFHVKLASMKNDKSTMNMEVVDFGEDSDTDMSHVGGIKKTFQEPGDNQMLCTILDMLPRSKKVVMPWPQARGYVPTGVL